MVKGILEGFWIYILRSKSTGETYIGYTCDLNKRLREHNDPNYRWTLHTKRRKGPWELIYFERFEDRSTAMRREKFLKSGQGRQWLKDQGLK